MSFSLTTPQMLDGSKDVTRRLGWRFLRPCDLLWAVEKAQGLKKGQHVKRLGKIWVRSIRREPLSKITKRECIREGFPRLSPAGFVRMFCEANHCRPTTMITISPHFRRARPESRCTRPGRHRAPPPEPAALALAAVGASWLFAQQALNGGVEPFDLINGTFDLALGATLGDSDGPKRALFVLPQKYDRLCVTFDKAFPDSTGKTVYCRQIVEDAYNRGSPVPPQAASGSTGGTGGAGSGGTSNGCLYGSVSGC